MLEGEQRGYARIHLLIPMYHLGEVYKGNEYCMNFLPTVDTSQPIGFIPKHGVGVTRASPQCP